MNTVRISILTLHNRWFSGKIGTLKCLRNHYYLRKFSAIVREKKGTMENISFQAHLDLDLFKLPEQVSREDPYPCKGITFFL